MAVKRIPVHVVDSISLQKTSMPLLLPIDVESRSVAAAVAKRFGHGLADAQGHRYDYRLRDGSLKLLSPSETLAEAEVKPESTLYLTYNPTAAGEVACSISA
jgi:hypothetical protein